MKKPNMKVTTVFDGVSSVEDIFCALLSAAWEEEQAKRKSRKSDFIIDIENVIDYNKGRFTSYLSGLCG